MLDKHLNIDYYGVVKSGSGLASLDIYGDKKLRGAPVLLFFHGGGWWQGDKVTSVFHKAEFFVGSGYVFISANYRLVPEIRFPANIEDVAKAVAWTFDNVSGYGGNPNRIFISGHSAGAHLAALVATDENYLRALGKSLSIIKGCIPIDSAAYDIELVMEYARSRGVKAEVYENAFTVDPEIWRQASPINWVSPSKSIPPFLLIHAAERPDSATASLKMAHRLRSVGVRAEVFPAINKTHESLNRDFGLENDSPTIAAADFLSGNGGNPASLIRYVPAKKTVNMPEEKKSEALAQARALFKRWDKNQDGRLLKSEVPQVYIGQFVQVDQDGDGIITESDLASFLTH